jgi:hypothetical protein
MVTMSAEETMIPMIMNCQIISGKNYITDLKYCK